MWQRNEKEVGTTKCPGGQPGIFWYIRSMDYTDELLEYWRRPTNFGVLGIYTHTRCMHNEFCGDRVEWYLQIKKGRVEAVSWNGEGCVLCVVGASVVSEKVKLIKSMKLIKLIESREVLEDMGVKDLSPTRLKCALLGWEGIRDLF